VPILLLFAEQNRTGDLVSFKTYDMQGIAEISKLPALEGDQKYSQISNPPPPPLNHRKKSKRVIKNVCRFF
jgi:hypothetical protein